MAAALAAGAIAQAEPSKVELQQAEGNWQLRVDGQRFFINGAGGDGSKELLKQIGGNAFRTWGVGEDTQAKLDEAQRLGLKVAVGIWLGHERHGFSYTDADRVAKQREQARKWILRYKDHPALLCWGIGNEMEGFKEGNNPAIWSAVNDIAALAHELDPNHPTMTTVAEIGGKRVESIHALCPEIDIVGINTYGGGPSISTRYRAAGGKKPFVITEYGPAGTWEVGKNDWGVPLELTSTQKAAAYRATFTRSIDAERDRLCLGGFAFAWGNKQEATATWYGMFLPDGSRLEAIDTMRELWTGTKVENRCPQIQPLRASAQQVSAGENVRITLDVLDPEGEALSVKWILQKDPGEYNTGGDAQPEPPSLPEAIVKADVQAAELKMPQESGKYWLYAYVRDTSGGAAVANLPLLVKSRSTAAVKPIPASVKFPVALFRDGLDSPPYVWSGWMGNTVGIAMDEKFGVNARSGATCMRCEYRGPDAFGGIIWQDPANDWGDLPGGRDLGGATKLTFWARGQRGGEKVKFVYGILGKEKKFPDSAGAEREISLTSEWKQYEFDLVGKDLTRIKTGFGWIAGGQGAPITFYLDDVQYE